MSHVIFHLLTKGIKKWRWIFLLHTGLPMLEGIVFHQGTESKTRQHREREREKGEKEGGFLHCQKLFLAIKCHNLTYHPAKHTTGGFVNPNMSSCKKNRDNPYRQKT
jgi:hypothetical protein